MAVGCCFVKMLLHFFLLLSSACGLSQTGGDEQTIAGDSKTCAKSISGDDSCEEGQRNVVDSCHRKENGIDVDIEEEKIEVSRREEKKRMRWQELDWAAYQALDINPADQEEPTARYATPIAKQ